MGFRIRFVLSLAISTCIIVISLLIFNAYIVRQRRAIDDILQHRINSIEEVLLANINFLRARRAEKNFIIFREDKYEKDLFEFLKEADYNLLRAESFKVERSDIEALEPLKNNFASYRELLKPLLVVLKNPGASEKAIVECSIPIQELNNVVAENNSYFLEHQRERIEKDRVEIYEFLNSIGTFLLILMVFVAVSAHLTVPYLVLRIFKKPIVL